LKGKATMTGSGKKVTEKGVKWRELLMRAME
jgi:hypothetical protein